MSLLRDSLNFKCGRHHRFNESVYCVYIVIILWLSTYFLCFTIGGHYDKYSILIESMMGLRPTQGNLRLVSRLFSLMRCLLKWAWDSLSRPQPHHWLFFSPITFSKTEYPMNSKFQPEAITIIFKLLFFFSYSDMCVNFTLCMHFTWLTVDVTFPVHNWVSISYSAWNFHGK